MREERARDTAEPLAPESCAVSELIEVGLVTESVVNGEPSCYLTKRGTALAALLIGQDAQASLAA
jgi:hypothetical protein